MAEKIFRFKLKAGSGEMRHVSVAAASKEEAEETVLRQEQKKVVFALPAEEAVSLEKRLKEGSLTGRDKGMLFAHHQQVAYKIVKGS